MPPYEAPTQPCRLLDAQVVHDGDQALGLVIGADAREIGAAHGPGRPMTAAQVIHAEHAKAVGIERLAGTDHVVPPGLLARIHRPDVAAAGNATQRRHDGGARARRPADSQARPRRSGHRNAVAAARASSNASSRNLIASRQQRGAVDTACGQDDVGDGGDCNDRLPSAAGIRPKKRDRVYGKRAPWVAATNTPGPSSRAASQQLIFRRTQSPWSWHHFGRVRSDGCPGFKGPFPQPVSMSGAKFRGRRGGAQPAAVAARALQCINVLTR